MTAVGVIVIGGSAGALDALLTVLPALPDSFAIPIVVVLHVPSDQPSLVPELLARACRRRVCEVDDKQPLAEHTIFVAPPNYHVLVERTYSLALSVDDVVNYSRPSIDVLFESAADALGARVAAVLLSGTSHDGAAGMCRITGAGGIAIVQDPTSAQHPRMPAAALASAGPTVRAIPTAGLADFLASLDSASHQGQS
jgi:two-component system, chemotaxis family, protein-glutamate methylesterase/glutaminase